MATIEQTVATTPSESLAARADRVASPVGILTMVYDGIRLTDDVDGTPYDSAIVVTRRAP